MSSLPQRSLRAVRTTEDSGIGDLPSSSLPELSPRLSVDAGSVDGLGSGDDCGSDLGTSGEDPALALFCSDAKRLGYKLIQKNGIWYPPAPYYREMGMTLPYRFTQRIEEDTISDVAMLIDLGVRRVG